MIHRRLQAALLICCLPWSAAQTVLPVLPPAGTELELPGQGMPGQESVPGARQLVRPGGAAAIGVGRALTPLTGIGADWLLPHSAVPVVISPPTATTRTLEAGQEATIGTLTVQVTGVWISHDHRWARLNLNLGAPAGRFSRLSTVKLAATGDQGTTLAVLPGLYDRAGLRQTLLPAGQSRELAAWVALPIEGRGDTAIRGTEQVAMLTLSDGMLSVRLLLPH